MGLPPRSRWELLLAALLILSAMSAAATVLVQCSLPPGQADPDPPFIFKVEPDVEFNYYTYWGFMGSWRIFVNFTYSDPAGIDLSSVAYYLDGVKVAPDVTVTPGWAATTLEVPNGDHVLRFVVKDTYGNTAAFQDTIHVADGTFIDIVLILVFAVVIGILCYAGRDIAGWIKRLIKPPKATESDKKMQAFIYSKAEGSEPPDAEKEKD